MTCRHVLGLIDAGPFADYPAPHLDAAWSHANNCPTCGPAMRASHAMTDQLRRLAQPPAPSNVATTVMARIARLETPVLRADAPLTSGHDRPVRVGWNGWVSAATITVGVLIIATTSGAKAISQVLGPVRPGTEALVAGSWMTLAGLTLGLVIYLMGLMMPLWQRRT
ncbi:MAG: hypothetical protein ABI051_03495 [Vicinamibacterales bacterium]